jgi:hypothetical protein
MTLMRLNPLFPFDPTIDSVLEHRHLILAYVIVLTVQIGYLGFLIHQFLVTRKASWQVGRKGGP